MPLEKYQRRRKSAMTRGMLDCDIQAGYHGNRLAQRLRLWRAGNTLRPIAVLFFMTVVASISLLAVLALRRAWRRWLWIEWH